MSHIEELKIAIEKHYPLVDKKADRIMRQQPIKLMSLTERKINDVILNDVPKDCAELFKNLQTHFSGLQIVPEFHRQFPNYALTIVLDEDNCKDFQVVYNLKIRISLIVDYFVVFYEEVLTHNNISGNPVMFQPLKTQLISSSLRLRDHENIISNEVKKLVTHHFPNHNYLNHLPLFKSVFTDSLPFGAEEVEVGPLDRSFYTFLFDNEFLFRKNVNITS